MKRSIARDLGHLCITAAALACLSTASSMAQSPAKPDKPAKAAKATEDVPTGPGSLNGLWTEDGVTTGVVRIKSPTYARDSVTKTADGQPVPFQPWAAAIVDKRLTDSENGHPYASTQARCLPAGVPDMMFENGAMQFMETPTQFVVLRQEFTFFRIVHMNQKTHPAPDDLDPTFLGHSIGHWEGDTLVVDTVGLNEQTGVRFVMPHSDQLHVIERYRRTGPNNIELRATIDDPKTFTKPWDMVTHFRRQTGELTEYFCENNRNGTDANGNETVIQPPAK